jgi:hypothetical protein
MVTEEEGIKKAAADMYPPGILLAATFKNPTKSQIVYYFNPKDIPTSIPEVGRSWGNSKLYLYSVQRAEETSGQPLPTSIEKHFGEKRKEKQT